jgi:fumarylpyruvate hydrolase
MVSAGYVYAPAIASAAIVGDARRFAVRRIYCVGRNYAAHAREMGGDPTKEPPFFFMKPSDAVTAAGDIPYPPDTDNLHHEVELVVAIGHAGREIDPVTAWAHVFGYGVGVDLTRRDRQGEARAAGQPWEKAKAFDHSAPLSALTPAARAGRITAGRIALTVNGAVRQSADIADLIWTVPEIVAAISRSWALEPGDLIYTGTPEGVGALTRGDEVRAHVDALEDLQFRIV